MTDSRADGWALLGLGTTLAGCLVGPTALGWLIDHLAGTFPVFLLIGLVLGIAATARLAYTEMSKFLGS
ncbi:MAG: putative F0F1-ATPase subunit Ca2+/Mg2+ transporter [Microbacteriaceae bacterium]|jgi:F0F1-type ATP synthase assembly protein I|nr:putative F0F1-ATPase subunit Ca2+/Mg2+ transporter [Microbacteriaceae bacterium]MDT7741428.1 putative F0F1-ATPase subunit Ca2+/Mg2+ transporter [Actinomycetota bacterium]